MNHKYKILLPVTNNPELVQDKLKGVDLAKLIIVNNFDNKEVELLCKQAENSGSLVYRYPRNLGLAASWNLGLKKMLEDKDDFIIILSASAVFDKSIDYFVDGIANHEIVKGPNCRYLASGLAALHCFAQTVRSIQKGGYFDENFWPIYFEDTDYTRRTTLNGVQEEVVQLNLSHIVHSKGYSLAMKDRRLFRLYELNADRIGRYYVSKWGGVHLSEKFLTPFNDPRLGVNDWIRNPSIFTWPPGVYEGLFT